MPTLKQLSSVTLQEQLYSEILKQIKRGEYKPGDKIPTELQLSEFYQVSRVTVRHALARLVDEQMLVKKPGKGTFVKIPLFVENIFSGGSFTDTCKRMNTVPSTKIIQKEKMASPPHLREKLGEQVIHITRLRMVNSVPCIVEEDYLREDYDFLFHMDIGQSSLLALISEKAGVIPSKFEDFFQVAYAERLQAQLLHCATGAPLLEVNQNVMSESDELIYNNLQFIQSERYVYAVRSHR